MTSLTMMQSKLVKPSKLVATHSNKDIIEEVRTNKHSTVQRNYVLNDVNALKKKLKHESRRHEILIAKEAKDMSNLTIQLRTSFFEFAKVNMINDLLANDDITNVENCEAAKAAFSSLILTKEPPPPEYSVAVGVVT